jgi:Fe-S-cluster containining protein
MHNEKAKELFTTLSGQSFHFECHREISCFNDCCAKLRLILTPYDILRIKNRLGISSGSFLDRFTDTLIHEHPRFPMIRLVMQEDEEACCPFVTEMGCSIYEDRPGACRLYPLGRASTAVEGEDLAREKYFVINEAHCRGFEEKKGWTIDEWLTEEGLQEYLKINDKWLEILNSPKSLGPEKYLTQKHKMFFMASYDLDRFREFILKSRFFSLFDVDAAQRQSLASDDKALILFAFDWLKFSLFGEKTISLS